MATQVCPDCKTTFTVARAGAGVRCAKCASRARSISPMREPRAAGIDGVSTQKTLEINALPVACPPARATPPAGRMRAEAAPVNAPERKSAATQWGPYEILQEIGRGGMGLVLRARDEALKRDVAIKTLLPDARKNPTHELRFIQEAQIAGRLEHPGIAPVHLLSWDERGNGFFSMKLVSGQSLEKILDKWHGRDSKIRAEFPLPRLVSIFERVCETIGFAHSHGVIHRDLKPANVMIGEYGEVWVLDWGLAKVLGSAEPDDGAKLGKLRSAPKKLDELDSHVTLDGTVVGTPGYMAPEQTAGEAIDEGVDIFGLGGLLYEILSGHAPFTGKSVQELLVNSARGDVKAIPRKVHGRTVPRALAAIAHKCLRMDRRDRYRSTAELLKDLRAYSAGEPISAMTEGTLDRLKRFARRHGRALAWTATLGVMIVAILIAAGITVWRQDLVAREEREKRLQAEVEKKNAEAAGAEKDREKHQAEIDRESDRAQRLQAELDKQKLLAAGAEKAQRRLKAFAPYTEAMDLLMRGQLPDRAATLLRQALEIDPDFEEAQYALGEALQYSGAPLDAAKMYLKADELSRKIYGKPNPKALVSAGFMFDDSGYYGEAEDAFTAADKDGASDPLAIVGRVFRTGHTRKLKDGLKLAQDALKDAPHLWETHFAYGYVLIEGIYDGVFPPEPSRATAVAEFRKALELSPRQAEVVSWLAIALARINEKAECLEWMAKAIALDPKNGNRYFQRWILEREVGAPAQQIAKDIAEAQRLGINPMAQILYETLQAANANDGENAFRLAGQLMKASHDWPSFVINWAALGINTGHLQEVLPVFLRWGETHSDYYAFRLIHAKLLMLKGNLPAALKEADEGLKIAPYQTKLWTLRGEILIRGGKYADALEALNKSLELNPHDLTAGGGKAVCLAALKRNTEADACFEALKKQFANDTKELKTIEAAMEKVRKR